MRGIVQFLGQALVMSTLLSGGSSASPHVDHLPGTGLNIILSAPHGGHLKPSSIPDRTAGCWTNSQCVWTHDCGTPDYDKCKASTWRDDYTQELCRELYDALCTEYGDCPAAVINLLHRSKFDANRDRAEGAFDVEEVNQAWEAYHDHIDAYKANITGPGLFLDLHGHGHSIVRNELGYLIYGSQLNSGSFKASRSSIRALAERNAETPFAQLLRGNSSFGDLLEKEGFDSIPSPNDPSPNGASYFSGGYNTKKHGSRHEGEIDAIQIEAPRAYRLMPTRAGFVNALVVAISEYLQTHY